MPRRRPPSQPRANRKPAAAPAEPRVAPPRRKPEGQFELVCPFAPMGDQPQAIERLVESVSSGHPHQTLLGITGSGKTFTTAAVIEKLGRPALVLSPNKTLAAQLYSELKELFPHNAVEYF